MHDGAGDEHALVRERELDEPHEPDCLVRQQRPAQTLAFWEFRKQHSVFRKPRTFEQSVNERELDKQEETQGITYESVNLRRTVHASGYSYRMY